MAFLCYPIILSTLPYQTAHSSTAARTDKKYVNFTQAEARKRELEETGEWSRGVNTSSSYNISNSNNSNGRQSGLNNSIHSLDYNFLNHHPGAKYFTHRKSR